MKNNFKKLGIKILSMSLAGCSLFGAINLAEAMGRKKTGGRKGEAPSSMSSHAGAVSVEAIKVYVGNAGTNLEFIFSDGTKCKGATFLKDLLCSSDVEFMNSLCSLCPGANLIFKNYSIPLLPLGTQLKVELNGDLLTLMTLEDDGVTHAMCSRGRFEGREKRFRERFKVGLHRVLPSVPCVKRILLCIIYYVNLRDLSMEVPMPTQVTMPMVELKMSDGYNQIYLFPKYDGFKCEDIFNFMRHMQQLHPDAEVVIQKKLGEQCYPLDLDKVNMDAILCVELMGHKYPCGLALPLCDAMEALDKSKRDECKKKLLESAWAAIEAREKEEAMKEEAMKEEAMKEEAMKEEAMKEEARKKRAEALKELRQVEMVQNAQHDKYVAEVTEAEQFEKEQAEVKQNLKKLSKEAKKESSTGSKEALSSGSRSSSASSEDETEAPLLTEEQFFAMCTPKGKKSYNKFKLKCPNLKDKVLEKAKYAQDNYGLDVADITKLKDGRWETRLNNEYRLYFIVEDGKPLFCQVGEHTPVKKGM